MMTKIYTPKCCKICGNAAHLLSIPSPAMYCMLHDELVVETNACEDCLVMITEVRMTPEGKIQKKILDYLENLDCCKVIKTIQVNEAGNPDIICCWRGVMVLLEVKKDEAASKRSSKDQPLQDVRIKEWNECGAYATKVWSVEQVEELLGSIRL